MAGRPLKFKDAAELQRKIDKYFKSITKVKWIDEEQRDENGAFLVDNKGKKILKPIKHYYYDPLPTITGMAVFLDTSRETLMNYEDKDLFFDTIKRAKEKIQAEYEESLRNRGNAGDIFALKNFGWKDKQEIEHSGNIGITELFSNLDEIDPEDGKE